VRKNRVAQESRGPGDGRHDEDTRNMNPPGTVTLGPLLSEHWPQARAIYEEGIRTGNATFEDAAPDWDSWDRSHLETCRLVAMQQGAVVAWAALSPVSRRKVYSGVAEVSIYVSAASRGQGIGRWLLAVLIEASEEAGIWTLQASVFPENEATVRLHTRAGFREVGRRERISRHHGRWRDTLVFERRSPHVGRV
jgi:L-amino acid N-acyltransferase YncA